MNELTLNFKDSLFSKLPTVIGDYIEIGIDLFIDDKNDKNDKNDNEIVKSIPIVNTIVGVLKFGKNVHDRNLLKQTVVFINEFNEGRVNIEKKEAYKKKIEKDSKKCEKELGRILILLNRYIDKEKSIMLARLFKAYISEIINWNEFCEYSEIINRLFVQDVELLRKIYLNELNDKEEKNEKYRIDRLVATGLIKDFNNAYIIVTEDYIEEHMGEYGKRFVEIVIMNNSRV